MLSLDAVVVRNNIDSSSDFNENSLPLSPSSTPVNSPRPRQIEPLIGYSDEIKVIEDIVQQYLESNIQLSGKTFSSDFITTFPPEIQCHLSPLLGAIYDTRFTKGEDIKVYLEAAVKTGEVVTVIDVLDSIKEKIFSQLSQKHETDNPRETFSFTEITNKFLIARDYRQVFFNYARDYSNINFLFYYLDPDSLKFNLVKICRHKKSIICDVVLHKWFRHPRYEYLHELAISRLKGNDIAVHESSSGKKLMWFRGWKLQLKQGYDRAMRGIQPPSRSQEELSFRPMKSSIRGWMISIFTKYLTEGITLQNGRLPADFEEMFKRESFFRDKKGYKTADYIDQALSEIKQIIDLRDLERIPTTLGTIDLSNVYVVDLHIPFCQIILLALTNPGRIEKTFDQIVREYETKIILRREKFQKLPPNFTLFYSYPSGRLVPIYSRLLGEREEVYHRVILDDYHARVSTEELNLIGDLKITDEFLNLLSEYDGYVTDSLISLKGASIRSIIDNKARNEELILEDPSASLEDSDEENSGIVLFQRFFEGLGKQFQIRQWKELLDSGQRISIEKRGGFQGESVDIKTLDARLFTLEEIEQEILNTKESGQFLEILDIDYSVWRRISAVLRGYPHMPDFRRRTLEQIKERTNNKRENRRQLINKIRSVFAENIEYYLLGKDGEDKLSLVADYTQKHRLRRLASRLPIEISEDPFKPISESEWVKLIGRQIDDELISSLITGGQKVRRLAEWKGKTIQSAFEMISNNEYPKEPDGSIKRQFVLGALYYSHKTALEYYDPKKEEYFDDNRHITEALSDPDAFKVLVSLRKFRVAPPKRRKKLSVDPVMREFVEYVERENDTISYESVEKGKQLVNLCKVMMNAMDQNATGFRSVDHPVLDRKRIEELQTKLVVRFNLRTWQVFTRFINPPENFRAYSFLSGTEKWFEHRLIQQLRTAWRYYKLSKDLSFEFNRRAIFTRGASGSGKSRLVSQLLPRRSSMDIVRGGIGNVDALKSSLRKNVEGKELFQSWQVHEEASAVRYRSMEEEMHRRTITYGGIHDGRLLTLGELEEKLDWARKVGIEKVTIRDVDADFWFSILSVFNRYLSNPEDAPCVPFKDILLGFIDARKNRQSFIDAIFSGDYNSSSGKRSLKVEYYLHTPSFGIKDPVAKISAGSREIWDKRTYNNSLVCDEDKWRSVGDQHITAKLVKGLEKKYGEEKVKGIKESIQDPPITILEALDREPNPSSLSVDRGRNKGMVPSLIISSSSEDLKSPTLSGSFAGSQIKFRKLKIRGDGNCGFESLRISRSEVKDVLIALIDREDIRLRLCEEVYEAFIANSLEQTASFYSANLRKNGKQGLLDKSLRTARDKNPALPNFADEADGDAVYRKSIEWLEQNNKTDDARHLQRAFEGRMITINNLQNYCQSPEAYRLYCKGYLSNLWLGCESAAIVAEQMKFPLYIWQESSIQGRLNLRSVALHSMDPSRSIHLLYSNGNHFDRLVPITVTASSELNASTSSNNNEVIISI